VFAERLGQFRVLSGPPHLLRPSFATNAVRRGVSPLVLIRPSRHCYIKTTLVYARASSLDDLVTALDKMPWSLIAGHQRGGCGLLEAPQGTTLSRAR
jgi:hypothetical protein